MSENKAIEIVDWFGKWLDNGVTKELIEESPEWIARQKEIQEELNKPIPPNPTDLLGKRMVALEGDLMAVEVINKMMGTQLIEREFEILRLNSEKINSDKKITNLELMNATLGKQVVQLDMRLLKGGIL